MSLDDIVNLCKRRGFIYQSSILYGGLQGFFDYGPLGVELKNNIKKAWWKDVVYLRNDILGIDCANILNKDVLFQSGHQDGFEDVFIDCKKCKSRFKEEEIIENICINCSSSDLSEPRRFNLMMNVNIGPISGEYASLRPETAQSIFINFKNVCDSFSPKLPFGIAQIGKAFRNEVTPRNFIFRCREFEQMEMEFFLKEEHAEFYFEEWKKNRLNWWKQQGVKAEFKDQTQKELAHYSKATCDIVFQFPHGLEEIEGIANRLDFDLGSHTKMQSDFAIQSKVKENKKSVDKLSYFDGEKNFIPHIIETSAGVERAFLAILTSAYKQEIDRLVLQLPFHLAPIKIAIIPLAKNNEEIVSYSKNLLRKLKLLNIFPVVLEPGGNIGKCYKKNDEIGTPFCLTVDFETLNEQKDTVTIRHRDSMKQERIHIDNLEKYFTNVF